MKKAMLLIAVLVMFLDVSIQARHAQAEGTSTVEKEKSADLAQELTNPLADLMTIPIQMNVDRDIGPNDDGQKIQTNIQPVVPFHLNESWSLISRTILPVIYQDDIIPDEGSQYGLGDAIINLGYQWTQGFSTTVGYRYLEVDYKKDDFLYDVSQDGLVLGLSWRF